MHLLAIVALYISAVSFGTLLFNYIDRFFPDPLVPYYASLSNAVRWAIASLLIVFPVYGWVSWVLRRDEARDPAKRELRIRKWLLYFTLFAAAVVIIGDLVAVIYNFLGGDLTIRFILKVASVLFIAALVFIYYLWQLRSSGPALRDPRMRWFAWGAILVVAVATIGGFFLIGSPFQMRLARFDERRVQDLQNIQWQIINYWQKKERLPDSIAQLRDDISGFIPPQDPESNAAYEYARRSNLQFELCAIFKTETGATDSRIPQPVLEGRAESWSHGAGRVCFLRTIDPELYRLQEPVLKR
ncbi:MAG: hypothetical protein HY473_00155 [Candidatus Sungbacteria bacterium]|uniref:DUF5671 domain-containing protein n=1 Tax=Candidatus Sungiibacteriota bacterium TaxID=2750080 RepID=A0A932YW91_9BACT|nr:hypothetical protein [Candidatus Sungbacteria bacterium]